MSDLTFGKIKGKGKHIKSHRENGELVAQLYEFKKVQYVLLIKGNYFITRDEDNSAGINGAFFPYKFNSASLRRATKKTK